MGVCSPNVLVKVILSEKDEEKDWVYVKTSDFSGWSRIESFKRKPRKKENQVTDTDQPNKQQAWGQLKANKSSKSAKMSQFVQKEAKIEDCAKYQTVSLEVAMKDGPGAHFDSVGVVPSGRLLEYT